jgi:outer membrane lipoprotein SlyB
LYLNKGDGSELVISHDNGNQTIRVVTDDLDVVEYELPSLAEVAPLLYPTEMI